MEYEAYIEYRTVNSQKSLSSEKVIFKHKTLYNIQHYTKPMLVLYVMRKWFSNIKHYISCMEFSKKSFWESDFQRINPLHVESLPNWFYIGKIALRDFFTSHGYSQKSAFREKLLWKRTTRLTFENFSQDPLFRLFTCCRKKKSSYMLITFHK